MKKNNSVRLDNRLDIIYIELTFKGGNNTLQRKCLESGEGEFSAVLSRFM